MTFPESFARKFGISCHVVPNLESIALIKVVTTLWSSDVVVTWMNSITNRNDMCKWNEIESKVRELVPQLSLTAVLQREVLNLVKPIGVQVSNWKKFHNARHFMTDACYIGPYKLHWTQQGTIDRKKTAEELVKDCNLSADERYIFACVYCLEADVTKLWKEKLIKHQCIDTAISKTGHWNRNWRKIIDLWTDVMTKGVVMSSRRYHMRVRRAFEDACFAGLKETAEYLLRKLNATRKKFSLRKQISWCLPGAGIFPAGSCYVEVMFFLLSRIEEEELSEALRTDAHSLLVCFLQWPWHNWFMHIANRLWCYISEYGCESVLRKIAQKMMNKYEDCNYRELFNQIRKKCIDTNKKINLLEKALFHLYIAGDMATLSLIWKEATVEQQKSAISYYRNFQVNRYFSSGDNEYFTDTDLKLMCQKMLVFLSDMNKEDREPSKRKKHVSHSR